MVTACRSYITENGTVLIWDQDAKDLIRKIQVTRFIAAKKQQNSLLFFGKHCNLRTSHALPLAGLHQLVPEVSVFLPDRAVDIHIWHEALQGFRNPDFKKV